MLVQQGDYVKKMKIIVFTLSRPKLLFIKGKIPISGIINLKKRNNFTKNVKHQIAITVDLLVKSLNIIIREYY